MIPCFVGPSFQDGRGSAATAASSDDSGLGMTSVGEAFFKAVSWVFGHYCV
jgi:hypothetical protein